MEPLRPDDHVELLVGAPVRTTASVYPGAHGRVVKIHPPSPMNSSAWITTRFSGGDLVQVPVQYLQRISSGTR